MKIDSRLRATHPAYYRLMSIAVTCIFMDFLLFLLVYFSYEKSPFIHAIGKILFIAILVIGLSCFVAMALILLSNAFKEIKNRF